MILTETQLVKIMPLAAKQRAIVHLPHIIGTLEEFSINTRLRIAAFLAQIAHESGELRYVEEIASGEAYEGRVDLGNTEPGDGKRFKGRGFIQLTGRANYGLCGQFFGIDFVGQPELVSRPEWAVRTAGWFWTVYKGLNPLADTQSFKLITKKINGGYNGLKDREKYYNRALSAL